MKVYIDTHEGAFGLRGAGKTTTTMYDVRLAATKSRDGRVLGSFRTLAAAQEYADAVTDPRWGMVQNG